jgi:hypothetical protein
MIGQDSSGVVPFWEGTRHKYDLGRLSKSRIFPSSDDSLKQFGVLFMFFIKLKALHLKDFRLFYWKSEQF